MSVQETGPKSYRYCFLHVSHMKLVYQSIVCLSLFDVDWSCHSVLYFATEPLFLPSELLHLQHNTLLLYINESA